MDQHEATDTAQDARWPPGATVAVTTLGNKRGTVVSSVRGRYRVRVEGVVVACRESDLAEVAGGQKPGRKARRAHAAAGHPAGTPRDAHGSAAPARVPRIDLHGLSVEEALARVDDALNRALLEGAERLEVLHGRGSGRIRDALHRHLESLSVVPAFRLDPLNPGVTIVHL